VSDDHTTVAAYGFICTNLLRMPMCVNQCVNPIVACRSPDGAEQRIGICPKPAVNHKSAFFPAHGDHIATSALKEFEATDIRCGDSWRSLWRAEGICRQQRAAERSGASAQKAPT
jgi:hypothetical protein